MAKTILEDISAFLAQQNAWTVSLPYDISTLHKITDDNLLFVGEQLSKTNDDIQVEISKLSLSTGAVQIQLNDFIINYNKQIDAIKRFISSHKGEYLIEIKKIYTRLDKEHNWVVKELTGAATDRVDIRQELGYEITKRRSQDNVLNTKIESEIYDRISKQDQLKADLEASIAATNINVSTIDTKISTETTARTNSITTLSSALANEVVARNNADGTLNNAITTLSNNLSIEAATRVSQDNNLSASIISTKNTLSTTISEIETRRISDLGILSSRDNLEEDESKKRDYILLQELRNIYSSSVNSEVQTVSAPLDTFSNGVNDWNQFTVVTPADVTGMLTSDGSTKFGLLANTIRKLNALQKAITGSTSDVYDITPVIDNSSPNTKIGLDYWQGSEYQTSNGDLKHKVGASNKSVLNSDNTADQLDVGKDFKIVTLANGSLEVNLTDSNNKQINVNGIKHVVASTVLDLSINTSSGVMSAFQFAGTATSAQYADIAERYQSDKIYPAGTVLSIGGEYEVTLYDPNLPLAGVVSTDPAFKMNDKYNTSDEVIDSNHYNDYDSYNPFIALKGRIPVKVSNVAKKGYYILADSDTCGKGIAIPKSELCSTDYNLRFIGIALSDSIDGIVEVKV